MGLIRNAVDPGGKFSVSEKPEKPAKEPEKRKVKRTAADPSARKRKKRRKAPTIGSGGFRGGV